MKKLNGVKKTVYDAVKNVPSKIFAPAKNVTDFSQLIRRGVWTEDTYEGGKISMQGEIWTDAIQKALDTCKSVYIPHFSEPIYIDAPLIVGGGSSLEVHPLTKIHLLPDTNTCMVRNRSVRGGKADENIIIKGGIWSTLTNWGLSIETATGMQRCQNGNYLGRSDKINGMAGSHGVFFIFNAAGVRIEDVTVAQSAAYGVHIGKTERFIVERIRFDRHMRDGIHVAGPTRYGVINDISGLSNDDVVALNAWDWEHGIIEYGAISHIVISNINADCGQNGDFRKIRLLSGEKNGIKCDISDIAIENTTGIDNFKMYCQPNLEYRISGKDDCSDTVGCLRSIYINNVSVSPFKNETQHLIEICSDIQDLCVSNVAFAEDYKSFKLKGSTFINVGPMSQKLEFQGKEIEVFAPEASCLLQGVSLSNVTFSGVKVTEESKLLTVRRLVGEGKIADVSVR